MNSNMIIKVVEGILVLIVFPSYTMYEMKGSIKEILLQHKKCIRVRERIGYIGTFIMQWIFFMLIEGMLFILMIR